MKKYYIVASVPQYHASRILNWSRKLRSFAALTIHSGSLSEMKDRLTDIVLEQLDMRGVRLRKDGSVYDPEQRDIVYSRSMKTFSDDIYTWEILSRAEIKKQYDKDPEEIF